MKIYLPPACTSVAQCARMAHLSGTSMPYPKKVRLHYGNGEMKSETYSTFCHANHLTHAEGIMLLAQWERKGVIKRRPDGGFDVVKHQPRLTVAQAEKWRIR